MVGGGPTGVEIAGQIAELSNRVLKNDFRGSIRPARASSSSTGEGVLAVRGPPVSKGGQGLERLGVEIHTEHIVTHVDRNGVVVKSRRRGARSRPDEGLGGRRPGIAARSSLADASGAECDRAGRIEVLPDCTIPEHPEVFAIGDMMALDHLPGVAEVAMQQGIHASSTIKRRLRGEEAKPFRYRDLGSMATISRFRAVVSFKGIRLSGFLGWLVWLFVHLAFLTGFKNRLATIPRWAFTFIGNARPQRTITMQQALGRVAIEEAGGQAFIESLVRREADAGSGEGPAE